MLTFFTFLRLIVFTNFFLIAKYIVVRIIRKALIGKLQFNKQTLVQIVLVLASFTFGELVACGGPECIDDAYDIKKWF